MEKKQNKKIILGSFYTPDSIVNKIYQITKPYLNKKIKIIDFGSGEGSFLKKFKSYKNVIATDIDKNCINYIKDKFKNVKAIHENSLINVSRNKYRLNINDELICIGNPPYNDITSHYKKNQKGMISCDADLSSRDLGISFLKMFNKLKANYICVLHPLSYLIKETNFNLLKDFKNNYKLIKGWIFSSKEFESIKKEHNEFPVIIAFYKRNENNPMDYTYIKNFKFNILHTNKKISFNSFFTINDVNIKKYPNKNSNLIFDKLQFYTIRDINSLCRNKTFVRNSKNGILIEDDDIFKYAWLDYLKMHIKNTKKKLYFLYSNLPPLYPKNINNLKDSLLYYIVNNNKIAREYLQNKPLFKKYFNNEKNFTNTLAKEINKIINF